MGGGSGEPDAAPILAGSDRWRPLTNRQLEILTHVARGQSNREIGEALGISARTVRNHLRDIALKLSTSDRTHAVVLAIGHGWIPIPIESEPAAASALEVVSPSSATDAAD